MVLVFFFFWRIRGPWVCYHLLGLPYVVFFFRLGLLSHLLFRIDVGLWAVGLLCYFFFFLLESRIDKIYLFIYLRVFLILLEGVPIFFKR